MSADDELALIASRAGGRAAADDSGEDAVAELSLASVRTYPNLDALDAAMEADPRVYRRYGNSTVSLLETALAALEGVGGETPVARATASGQAALALLISAAMSRGRRRVVLVRPCYGGTESLLLGPLAGMGVTTTIVDLPAPTENAAGQLVAAALGSDVAAVVAEVVTNPLMGVVDVPAVCEAAHCSGAICIVDATLATPFLFRPLAHGADAVVHSLTKHLSGHSDVLGGAVLVSTQCPAADWLDAHCRALGVALGPFDAWLTLRGLRTAALRMERASASAAALAASLSSHPAVAAVHYPGARGAADRELADRLLPDGAGAMLSLELHGGLVAAGSVVRALRGVRLAPSLGDVSTTVSHPASTSHRQLSRQARAALGISDGLLRFSVGVEPLHLLEQELRTALSAA